MPLPDYLQAFLVMCQSQRILSTACWKRPACCLSKTYRLLNLMQELPGIPVSPSYYLPEDSCADTGICESQTPGARRVTSNGVLTAQLSSMGYWKLYMLICDLCMSETSIPALTLLQFSLLLVHHHGLHPKKQCSFLATSESSNISALQNKTSATIPELLKKQTKNKS